MSMHKLLAGDGYAYLTRQVAAGDAGLGPDDSLVAYYESTGNPPGRWTGHGLAGFGDDATGRLRPGTAVTETTMAAVFRDGCDPLSGDPLGRTYQGRNGRPVVGFDLTFTVPKSASVLWALGDDTTRAAVHAAHRAAVDQALEFVDRTVARTRVGHAGCRQVRTRGVVAAAFDHWDTRTGDPNLHTHVVVANKVQGPDGAWRSLDGKTIHAATVTVSALYDALLADELTRRLPVTWSHRSRGPRRNPAFEIDGVDDTLLAAFSTRSEQIHCAEQAWIAQFQASHGRGPSRDEMLDAALDGFLTAGAQGRVAVLQAADNRTVRDLNLLARARGIRAGTVRPDGVDLHDGLVAGVGDRIVTRRNHRRLHTTDGYVRNGNLWDVVGVGNDGSLRVRPAHAPGRRDDAGPTVLLPGTYVAEHVELGYATSTARTQGVTADQTHTIAAPGMAREDLYVGMSRGRDLNRTYVVTDRLDDDCVPAHPGQAASYREVLDAILATSHAEPTATETWDAYHPDAPAPVAVPPLRPPHDYGRSAPNRWSSPPPAPAPAHDGPVRQS